MPGAAEDEAPAIQGSGVALLRPSIFEVERARGARSRRPSVRRLQESTQIHAFHH